ncbi:hypothetical protein HPB52_021678 [Rhipicephalus sanguineus]|uniref:HTH CENPB-type domain-containing protein n=1 Tax=Rhipicephalus sanguineus TaxID=34632 RepID=A0A9D4Q3D9_RHISA|nr:hypothetical protein HPB52_021678 [Rhipicephalus sanguineus]
MKQLQTLVDAGLPKVGRKEMGTSASAAVVQGVLEAEVIEFSQQESTEHSKAQPERGEGDHSNDRMESSQDTEWQEIKRKDKKKRGKTMQSQHQADQTDSMRATPMGEADGGKEQRRVIVAGDVNAYKLKLMALNITNCDSRVVFNTKARSTLKEASPRVETNLQRHQSCQYLVVLHAGMGDLQDGMEPQESANYLREKIRQRRTEYPQSHYLVYANPDFHAEEEESKSVGAHRPCQLLNKVGTRRTRSLWDLYHLRALCLESTQGDVKVAVPAVSTRQLVRQQEKEEWVRTAEKKSSMTVYMMGKRDIAKEAFFDNSRGSGLLAEARSGVKRLRLGNYQTVDDAVLTWYKDARQHSVPLSGRIIQEKARQFAVVLGTSGFDASAGWPYRFRQRNDIMWQVACGEEKAADAESAIAWRNERFQEIVESFSPEVFNAKETGRWWRSASRLGTIEVENLTNEFFSEGKVVIFRFSFKFGDLWSSSDSSLLVSSTKSAVEAVESRDPRRFSSAPSRELDAILSLS